MTEPPFGLLTVITVTYNSVRLVDSALRSAQLAAKRAGVEAELIVVDNASGDQTATIVGELFPQARVIRNAENIGFGRANNMAFELANGDVWLLLNPDATLLPDALVPLLQFLDQRPAVGAVAPAIDTPWQGGPEVAGMEPGIRSMVGHFLLLNRLLWRDRGGPWRGVMLHRRRHLGPRPVDWLGAAALLVRPNAVRSVGGFDERFFLYGEDVDLGVRLRRAAWELWLIPDARARHLVAGSQGRVSTRWVDAMHDYYASRASTPLVFSYDVVLAVGLTLRVAVRAMLGGGAGEDKVRSQTVRLSAKRARRRAWRTLVELW